ncbi:VOC family protein [Glycomyces sp. NPDC048151]|uniref:VOC family protein n=1 Tax=Glycomyces sp. NPDC048151 TaxID=3364002 RepID=UPI003710810C
MLKLTDFIIDCPEPMKLAAFYAEVTGRPVKDTGSWISIEFGEIELAFQQVDDFRPSSWPDDEHPKQFHLDFEVDDIDSEEQRLTALGATLRKDFTGEEGYGWRIYTDPVGHPFCLCRNKSVKWIDGEPVWPA